jgi:hypothetical protein
MRPTRTQTTPQILKKDTDLASERTQVGMSADAVEELSCHFVKRKEA